MRGAPHRLRLPGAGPRERLADRWSLRAYTDDELVAALVDGRVAGPVTSHDRPDVLWKIERLFAGEPVLQFGLSGVDGIAPERVLGLMAEAGGFDPDPGLRRGPTPVDPLRILVAASAAGERLVRAASRGERVLLATGHPAGLTRLYGALSGLLGDRGAAVVHPPAGAPLVEGDGRAMVTGAFGPVAHVTGPAGPAHSHWPQAMRVLLGDAAPDLVVADHGMAGAAIEAGVDAISVVDVNDPAPVVARAQGRTEHVICMDDNVHPDSYWPVFQALGRAFGVD